MKRLFIFISKTVSMPKYSGLYFSRDYIDIYRASYSTF